MSEEIISLLDRYCDLHERLEALRAEAQERREAAIPPEVRAAIMAIDAAYGPDIAALEEEINAMKTVIEAKVLAIGQTVKSARAIAVYNKGRVTWDTQALEGFAAAHPEILRFRKEGYPYVTIRWVK